MTTELRTLRADITTLPVDAIVNAGDAISDLSFEIPPTAST